MLRRARSGGAATSAGAVVGSAASSHTVHGPAATAASSGAGCGVAVAGAQRKMDHHAALSPGKGAYTLLPMESFESFAPAVQKVCLWAVPILVAVILHEIAHGYVAFRLGDPTAAQAGRLTLNPFSHVDWFGTVILPLLLLFGGAPFLFGYAKPVPVNFRNLRNPRRDMVLVALAGPAMNLLLAGLFAFVYRLTPEADLPNGNLLATNLLFFKAMTGAGFLMNLGLAVFNLLPLPPLDGGRAATGLLPRSPALALARLEPYGMLIIMLLLASGVLNRVLYPMTNFLLQTLL